MTDNSSKSVHGSAVGTGELLSRLASVVGRLRAGGRVTFGITAGEENASLTHFEVRCNRRVSDDPFLAVRCDVKRRGRLMVGAWSYCTWTLDGLFAEMGLLTASELRALTSVERFNQDPMVQGILQLNEKSPVLVGDKLLILAPRPDKTDDLPVLQIVAERYNGERSPLNDVLDQLADALLHGVAHLATDAAMCEVN